MPNFLLSCIFGVLDPLVTLPAWLTTQLVDYSSRITTKKSDPEQDNTFSECRYRLDSFDPSILMLPDSRKLSYAQFGSSSPTARTIFFLHGWPGARTEGTYLEEAAKTHNVRIICVDRPGVGLSTPDPNRTVLAHAKDIECLAQHLKAERYGVLGVSGGGPYALACAKALPADKLKVVSIVCGLGPSDIGYWGMFPLNYLGWTISSQYTPLFTRWWFGREPGARLDLSSAERMRMLRKNFENSRQKMPVKDVPIFGDEDVMKVHLRTATEAFRQGTRWMMQDMKLLASDLGFKVEDIRKDLKVQLLYGRLDGNVPLRHGEEVARRLKTGDGVGDEDESRVRLRIRDDDTHASIFFDYREEILKDMMKAM